MIARHFPHFWGRCLLLLILSLALSFVAQAQEYRVFKQKFTGQSPKPSLLFSAQSASGHMWFVSAGGLIRFNGSEETFYPFPEDTQKPESFCFNRDTAFVGFSDGRIIRFANEHFEWLKWEEGFPKAPISSLCVDAKGQLWAGTPEAGLYVHNGRYLFHFGTEDGMPAPGLNDLAPDAYGHVWAATDAGIARVSLSGTRKELRVYGMEAGLPDQLVSAISISGNTLCGGTHAGPVFYFSLKTGKALVPNLPFTETLNPVEDIFYDGQETWLLDASGRIYMYSQTRGAECIEINTRQINAEGRIKQITADDEMNLWLSDGSENALRIYRGLIHLREHESVSFAGISAIYGNHAGTVFFASPQGVFSHSVSFNPNRKLQTLMQADKLGAAQVVSLYADGKNTLWAGSFGSGLRIKDLTSGTIFTLNEKQGLLNDNVLSITGRAGRVYAATLAGISEFDVTQTWPGKALRKLPLGFNYCIGADTLDGKLWVGTDGDGLVSVLPDFSLQKMKTGPANVYSLAVYSGLGLVFSGQQPGLWGQFQNRLINFSGHFNFESISPTGLAVLPDSSVIVLHAGGFEHFFPFKNKLVSYDDAYGLGSFENSLNAISTDEYGNCWMASDFELIRFAAGISGYRDRPKTSLDRVEVLSKPLPPQKNNFAYDENTFTFKFSGIWFQNPEAVSFLYKMDGVDEDYLITRDHYVNYASLPPGDYVFRVKAYTGSAAFTGNEVVFQFRIKKPFWKEIWFYLPLIFLGMGLLYWIVKAREHRMAEKARMQKENTEFKFQTLKNQISPHFLFNSFNTLLYLIDSNPKKAGEYTEELSDFFRKVLEVREQNLISLREELDLMRNYANIQHARFEQALQLHVEVDEAYLDTFIPPLSGQMLLENALKHNALSKDKPLVFTIRIDEERKCIVFSNTLRPRRGNPDSTGLGLKNIIQRYRLLSFPDPQIEKTSDTFTVYLPIIYS